MDQIVSIRKFEAAVQSLQGDAAAFTEARGWKILSMVFPILSVAFRHSRSSREIEFRFSCDNWDEFPPSLTIHDPADGRELSWDEWPKNEWSVIDPHPSTGKPFLCLPGIREYHSFPGHVGDSWENYRPQSGYSLLRIVDRVHQRFEDSNG